MYVLRSALRASTGRPPARFIRGRRYSSPPRLRSFHTTRTLAQAGQPPSGSNNTPIGQDDVSNQDPNKAAAEEHAEAAVASEDPELLAQKLQRSRETSRRYSAALRRQQRSKKLQGLPPVHVPDWFLKRRVTRREDIFDGTGQRPEPACLAISVFDAQSGEQATCSVPASGDLDAAQVMSRLVGGLWKRRLDNDEKRKIEKYLGERRTLVEKTPEKDAITEPQELPDRLESDKTDELAPSTANDGHSKSREDTELSAMASKYKMLLTKSWAALFTESERAERHDTFTRRLRELEKQINRPETIQDDPSWSPQQRQEAILEKKEARLERWFMKVMISVRPKRAQRTSEPKAISPLVLAEIRASVAASLSALRPSVGDSFPAAKTNLILHSPTAAHETVVDECIHRLAEDLRSDLIVLTAQDLALLGGDYLGEGSEPTPRSIRSLGYETYRLSSEIRSAVENVAEATEESSEPDWLSSFTQPDARIAAFTMPFYIDASRDSSFRGSRATSHDSHGNANTSVNVLSDSGRTPSQTEIQLEDVKLAALLDTLLDANEAKQSRGLNHGGNSGGSVQSSTGSTRSHSSPAFFDYSVGSDGTMLDLNSALPIVGAGTGIGMNLSIGPSLHSSLMPERPKIIYVKDFKELNATHYGGRIIQKLEELVRKRRTTGESIMIVGSTCSGDLTPQLAAEYVSHSPLGH
jgi:hypothetical protein